MDIKKIKKLIELLEQSGISEMEIKEGEESIRLCKNFSGAINSMVSLPQHVPFHMMPGGSPMHNLAVANNIQPEHTTAELKSKSAVSSDQAVVSNGNILQLKSPIVGTFYRSSSPEAKPFVAVGDQIKVGDPVCIIEAMKMFNQIESEFTGTVSAILVESGQPVEYGQPLFNIIPNN